MKLMRMLTWLAAKNNFTIYSEHIPGVTNVISDALSRFDFQTFRAAAPTAEVKGTPCPRCAPVVSDATNVQFDNGIFQTYGNMAVCSKMNQIFFR
jgi:DUF971 family protein